MKHEIERPRSIKAEEMRGQNTTQAGNIRIGTHDKTHSESIAVRWAGKGVEK